MNRLLILACAMWITGCNMSKENVDLLIIDATIYTADQDFSTVSAMAIKEGRIVDTGLTNDLGEKYKPTSTLSFKGKFIYPGWIDAHCHFFGYGMNLSAVDVAGTTSVEEIIGMLKIQQEKNQGEWITGRGWDQNDWDIQEFPDRTMLDKHFPNTPILLRRIDGHAAWANTLALEMAGVTSQSNVEGGTVMVRNGEPTGILIDNAIGLVGSIIPEATDEEILLALELAERNCFSVGLTSVQDAGLSRKVVELIDDQYNQDALKIRINAWLSPTQENFKYFVEKGPYQNDHLSVNTIKLFTDGALGSRGALMMEAYSDDHENHGLYLTSMKELEALCTKAYEHHFAVATHCIGDAANRETLKLYAKILGDKNDRRWRIEHAQIIHPDDFHYFGDYSIIPSVQPTHATSDMYWAEKRVGTERMKGAYAYKQLLEENGWIPNGSDFPVEQINPLFGFYAAVARKDQEGYPENRFQPENALSREEALRAMTIWAAKAGFEEDMKGSIEPGKLADFVVTGKDLMTVPEQELFGIKVLATYLAGEVVYEISE